MDSKMICIICNSKTDAGEIIKCNGCKAVFHYRCVNITSADFKEGQVQLKRTFKCHSCSNVTERVRVTDDTPVRGTLRMKEISDLSLEGNYYQGKEGNKMSMSSEELLSVTCIINKVNNVIMEKMCALEKNIMEEIKASVTILASENSKLRQELKKANEKCSSYEQKIQILKSGESQERERVEKKGHTIEASGSSQRQATAVMPLHSAVSASSSSLGGSVVSDTLVALHSSPLPPPPPPPAVTYATMARGAAVNADGDRNGWTEVTRSKKTNPIKRGGNTSVASLKAVERRKFLHVWRLDKSTTEDNLKNYITNLLGNEYNITVEKLRHRTERDYASFRIGVPVSNFDSLCDPDFWPVNVEFSEWIWFRRSTNPNQVPTQ